MATKSWFIYCTLPVKDARKAVDAVYTKLGTIVGDDLAEHLDRGEDLEPPTLGRWPDITAVSTAVPKPEAATKGAKPDARVEEAAVARLATCVTTIRIDNPKSFDPALVTALRELVGLVGPCVFTYGPGLDVITSETLLADHADSSDLPSMVKAAVAGELDDDEDDDDDDDDEDDDDDDDDDEDEDEDEEEEEDDEPAPDSARPEILRGTLAAMAELPRARRKASELMGSAPEIVARFAERLARVGAEPDEAAARALGVPEKEVLGARKALALLLRRAESR